MYLNIVSTPLKPLPCVSSERDGKTDFLHSLRNWKDKSCKWFHGICWCPKLEMNVKTFCVLRIYCVFNKILLKDHLLNTTKGQTVSTYKQKIFKFLTTKYRTQLKQGLEFRPCTLQHLMWNDVFFLWPVQNTWCGWIGGKVSTVKCQYPDKSGYRTVHFDTYNRTSYTYSITGRPDIGFIE
jgi:hypothetical protein